MKTTFLRSAVMHGLIIGLCLVIYLLLDWMLGFYGQKTAFSLLLFAIIIAGLAWSAFAYRNKEMGGYITYGQAFSYSITVAAVFSLISVIFTLLLHTVIDPEYMTKIMELTEEKLYEAGMSQTQIDAALEISKRFSSPVVSFFTTLLSNMFISAIIALITSAFVKRNNPNPFTSSQAE